jgi:hypothetical protein
MKKLILAAFVLTTAASVFAQGTVIFINRSSLGTTHVWGPSSSNPSLSLVGTGLTDSPAGSVNYAGAGMSLIGASGASGQYGYATTFAQLLAANGSSQAESSLVPSGQITTFKSGTALGVAAQITDTLGNIPKDSAAATLEMVAWDNSSGLYPTWTQALVAWQGGLIAAGKSGAFTVLQIGGDVNTPPNMAIPSFNLYMVPEPSTFALLGLGAAAMMIFRRRK